MTKRLTKIIIMSRLNRMLNRNNGDNDDNNDDDGDKRQGNKADKIGKNYNRFLIQAKKIGKTRTQMNFENEFGQSLQCI